jgi:hypothetical protein
MPPSFVMANRDNRFNISAGGTCQFVDLKQALDYSQTEARQELATRAPHTTTCGAVQVCGWGTIRTERKSRMRMCRMIADNG